MALSGITKNIGISPRGYKDLDPIENFVPNHIELRNGFLTDAGYWHKRPGFNSGTWDVVVDESINLLIPEQSGFAVTVNGRVFKLQSTPLELTGARLSGGHRPTHANQDGELALADGGLPIKISGSTTSLLGGSPDKFRFIDRLGPYTIGCGHDITEFKWCASGNFENWTTGDSGFANVKKSGSTDTIKNFGVLKDRAFFFKGSTVELWYNRGGSTPFVRIDLIERGIHADYSLVKESDTFYWLGDDLWFYIMQTGNKPLPISIPYDNYIRGLSRTDDCYGLNFAKEHLIKWFFPTSGVCLVYDYKNKTWSEDNTWEHGQFERMPINSYMEFNGKQYFGDYDPTGKIYEWSKNYKSDNGKEIRVARNLRIKPMENGHNVVFERLGIRAKRGVATSNELNPKLLIRHKINNELWENYEEVDLGSVGDTNPNQSIDALGRGNEIEIESVETDAVDYLVTNMDLTVRELSRNA